MKTEATHTRTVSFHWEKSEFWSGDLGLTLITVSLVLMVFVMTPLREAGVPGRLLLEVVMAVLMIFGVVAAGRNRVTTIVAISLVVATACVLAAGRFHPTPLLHQIGSALTTLTLLLYAGVVVAVMFHGRPISWSRIQGGVSVYLLLGMAWASAYQIIEQYQPDSFRFVTAPQSFDELIAKLTYFSFCTLTTLGGDVSPVSPVARSLATAEALVGQLFPAIFIGALVAMAMQSRTKS